jgi:O-antigen/teichoic acid export membrane protein
VSTGEDEAGRILTGAGGEGRESTVVGNTGVLVAGRLVVSALGWAGTLLIIRTLTVREWGQFSFVYSFLGLLIILTNVVNGRQAIRGLYEADDTESFAGAYVTLRLALGVVGYPVALAVVVLGNYPPRVVAATAVAGLAIIIATPSDGYNAVFQSRMQMRPIAVGIVLGQVAQFGLTVVLVVARPDLVLLTIPSVLCEVVIIAWKVRTVRRFLKPRYHVDLRTWGHLLRLGIPYAIGSGLATLYYAIDTVMLSKLATFEDVGQYGIAYKFANVLQFFPAAVTW